MSLTHLNSSEVSGVDIALSSDRTVSVTDVGISGHRLSAIAHKLWDDHVDYRQPRLRCAQPLQRLEIKCQVPTLELAS